MTEKEGAADSGNPEVKGADEAALELMKQIIALASGVLALSATFLDKFTGAVFLLLVILATSWVALVVSVFFGLQTISAIVQSRLDPEGTDWSTGYGYISARLSKYGFVVGITLFAIFAFVSLV